jgi:hypothetical protein
MRLVVRIFLLFNILPLAGCFWFDEGGDEHIIGSYYTSGIGGSWGKPMYTVYLHFDDGEYGLADALLPQTLEAVGASEKCVILKTAYEGQYYIARIVPGADREVARKNILGPFDRQTFNQRLKEINGDTLVRFTHHYDAL